MIADEKEFLNRDYVFPDNNFDCCEISLVSLICGVLWHSSKYSSLFWQRNDTTWLQVRLLTATSAQCPSNAAFRGISFPLERFNCRFNYMFYLCRLVLGRLSSKPSGQGIVEKMTPAFCSWFSLYSVFSRGFLVLIDK